MTLKRSLILTGTLLLAALVIASGFMIPYSTINAQEPVPTTEPGVVLDAPHDPVAQATSEALEQQDIEERNRINIFDFQIAYLIAEDVVTDDSLVSPATFEQVFGAQSFHSWASFVEQDAVQPFQIIMIHDSLYAEVDTIWTQTAYRNRIILVGISMSYDHLVEITGDRCQNSKFIESYLSRFENKWLYFNYIYGFEDQSYKAYVDEQVLEACNDSLTAEDVGGSSGFISQGLANLEITSQETLDQLVINLRYDIMSYEITGAKQGLIPLPRTASSLNTDVTGGDK